MWYGNAITINMASTKPPLKILMLHGFTQSGPLFRAKTGALTKSIAKAFPLHIVSFSYPTGPLRLNPSDVPGYNVDDAADGKDEKFEIEAYGWWRRPSTTPPTYKGIEDGLASVAAVLRDEGPFDGVIGFSQGACLAFMVASLLEANRNESFNAAAAEDGVQFPEAFSANNVGNHPPLKFAIVYSGFKLADPRWKALYDAQKPVTTPVLHVLGTLDALVTEEMSRGLIEACAGDPEKDGKVVFHPGGHFVPSQKTYLEIAVGFIRRALEGDKKKEEEDERVEDMDVPF
ncbi:dihydrofolate reductase [Talaromyces stipitatus ATCC 10500]|uniref:Dihydrofolate reductase n=1 Tax=Talaromyces stipitatus (strain ATCC 10500 / CBS 375.48 / QM 6759 / NRRL 1006) TaxID=441959 RepID=B8MMV7_TALSN|nr:dihydrofolate reductase [Talaromyces stipitatus ATCC 10500]EED13860.1 dihydrofolate reductase [Talaromyces stipitatus ATCC 10500]